MKAKGSAEAFWSRSAQFHKREVLPRRDCYPSGLGMHRSATRLLHRHTICLPCLLSSAPRRCLQHTSKVASASKDLPPPDVSELARLAHLSVTDQQVKDWEPKLQSILQWFGQLQQADVSGIEPAVRADINASNVLRDDVPVECDSREELMAEVPEKENAYVKVPKIM